MPPKDCFLTKQGFRYANENPNLRKWFQNNDLKN